MTNEPKNIGLVLGEPYTVFSTEGETVTLTRMDSMGNVLLEARGATLLEALEDARGLCPALADDLIKRRVVVRDEPEVHNYAVMIDEGRGPQWAYGLENYTRAEAIDTALGETREVSLWERIPLLGKNESEAAE